LTLKFDDISKTGHELAPNLIRIYVVDKFDDETEGIQHYLQTPNEQRSNYFNLLIEEKYKILQEIARERHASGQSPSAASAQGATVPAEEAGGDIQETEPNSAESSANKESSAISDAMTTMLQYVPSYLRRSPRTTTTAESQPTAAENNGQGPAAASAALSQSDAGQSDDNAKKRESYLKLYKKYSNELDEMTKDEFIPAVRALGIIVPEDQKGKNRKKTNRLIRDANPHIFPHEAGGNSKPIFPNACTCTNPTAEAYDPYAAFRSKQPCWPNSQPSAYAAACDCEAQQQYWPPWLGKNATTSEPFYVPSCAPGQHIYPPVEQYYLAPYADSSYFRM
jgi:hypothetical protein